MKRIGEILTRLKTPVEIQDTEFYKRLTIRINHQGVSVRDTEIGAKIGTKNQFRVRAGDFILSKIDARQGAFGIVPEEAHDGIITGNFWTFRVDNRLVDTEWFLQFTNSDAFLDLCKRSSTGNTHRKYLNEAIFINHELAIPSLDEQRKAVVSCKAGSKRVDEVQHEIAHQQSLLTKLKQAILQEAIQGKLTEDLPVRQAGWRDPSFLNLSDKRVPKPASTAGRASEDFFTYVLECADGSLYKGMTQDLWARIDRHLAGQGSEHTLTHKPTALIHFESFESQEEARKREVYFKSGSGREWLKQLHLERRNNYEPASQLLQRIQAEKNRLADLPAGKAGKKHRPARRAGGKEKPLPKITPEEIPFEIPEGWEWCRLGAIARHSLGKMLDHGKNKGTPKPYLRNLNVQWFRLVLSDLKEMRFEDHEVEKYSVQRGDILICEGGYPGQAAIWEHNEPIMFQKALHRVRFLAQGYEPVLFVQYLKFADEAGFLKEYFTGSGIKHFTGSALHSFPIPLPPLAEQAAIVERMDALMTTCRALEAEIEQSRTHAAHLLQAVLKEAFAPPCENAPIRNRRTADGADGADLLGIIKQKGKG